MSFDKNLKLPRYTILGKKLRNYLALVWKYSSTEQYMEYPKIWMYFKCTKIHQRK